jgi:hypothetical protein
MRRADPTVFEREAPPDEVVDAALAGARDGCFWIDDAGSPRRFPALAVADAAVAG